MYRIAILGCENSHADHFLKMIKADYPEISVIGVYSNEPEAAKRVSETYDVPAADSPDAFVGKIDGLVITARDGKYHYPYAKPYIASGIPMLIDKPITSDGAEAERFMRELKAAGVRVTGGSSCPFDLSVEAVRRKIDSGELGSLIGGNVRAPIQMHSPYGGFFFYAQHLIQIMQAVFGTYPHSVTAFPREKTVTAVVSYAEYDVSVLYTEGCYSYSLLAHCEKGAFGGAYPIRIGDEPTEAPSAFKLELEGLIALLRGGEQTVSYRDFISPVYIMEAFVRSIASGKTEPIVYSGEI